MKLKDMMSVAEKIGSLGAEYFALMAEAGSVRKTMAKYEDDSDEYRAGSFVVDMVEDAIKKMRPVLALLSDWAEDPFEFTELWDSGYYDDEENWKPYDRKVPEIVLTGSDGSKMPVYLS